MIDFVEYNPRTCNFKNPYTIKDPGYSAEYKRMSRLCAFPAGFQNGLYHVAVGTVFCLSGIIALLGMRSGSAQLIAFIIGIVVSAVLAVAYAYVMQTKALFPRGACMMPDNGKPKKSTWIIALVAFVALPTTLFINGSNLAIPATVGSIASALQLISYIKTNRTSLLYTCIIMLLVPLIIMYTGLYTSTTTLGMIISVVPYEGIVMVVCGTFLSQKSIMPSYTRHNRDTLRASMASKDRRVRFSAVSFLCNSLDPELLPELLRCCNDESHVVAYTAQVALGNTWGPMPSGVHHGDVLAMRDDINEDDMTTYTEQAENGKKVIMDRWLKHYKMVEDKMRQLANENEQAVDDLIAIAQGQNVYYDDARVVALEMIGSMRTPRAYSTLMETLQHRSKRFARAAMAGFFGADSKAVLYLEKFFVGPRSWIKKRAIMATRCLLDWMDIFDPNEEALANALLEPDIEGLFNTDDTCVFAATIGLLPCESSADIDVIQGYYDNTRPIIKVEALWALTRANAEGIGEQVLSASHDASAAVRYTSILCMEKLRLSERLEVCQRMSTDINQKVADLAKSTYARIQSSLHPQMF